MSRVLVLATCSNHKLTTQTPMEYNPNESISSHLSESLRPLLFHARRHVRMLITSDKGSRDGVLLRSMPYNAELEEGADLGGTIISATYLPALQRYDGRFYRELGTTVLQRSSFASSIKHHFLIISGLYGLVLPTEQIQCYSCHIPDHPDISKYWIRKIKTDLLTNLLIDYISRYNITRVFDFMAVDCYRNLISWEMVRHATHDSVLHCYSKQVSTDQECISFLIPLVGLITGCPGGSSP